MNAVQISELAQRLADALDQAGITCERGAFAKGNLREYQRIPSIDVAARTIGTWLSWNWVPSGSGTPEPPATSSTSSDPAQSHLRLVDGTVNDDEDQS